MWVVIKQKQKNHNFSSEQKQKNKPLVVFYFMATLITLFSLFKTLESEKCAVSSLPLWMLTLIFIFIIFSHSFLSLSAVCHPPAVFLHVIIFGYLITHHPGGNRGIYEYIKHRNDINPTFLLPWHLIYCRVQRGCCQESILRSLLPVIVFTVRSADRHTRLELNVFYWSRGWWAGTCREGQRRSSSRLLWNTDD